MVGSDYRDRYLSVSWHCNILGKRVYRFLKVLVTYIQTKKKAAQRLVKDDCVTPFSWCGPCHLAGIVTGRLTTAHRYITEP